MSGQDRVMHAYSERHRLQPTSTGNYITREALGFSYKSNLSTNKGDFCLIG